MYKVLKDRKIQGKVVARFGDLVYDWEGFDFGLASIETFMFQKEFVTVTKDKKFFFTIPREDLE